MHESLCTATASTARAPQAPAAIAQQLRAAGGQPDVQCERRTVTLLFVGCMDDAHGDARLPAVLDTELGELAQRQGGCRDPFPQAGALLLFANPVAAMRMALQLQRSAAGVPLRIGLTTLSCLVASIREGTQEICTVLGAEAQLAAQVAASASSGSIVVAPSTYALVQADVQDDFHDCLLAEEFDGDAMAGATITPAPTRGGPELSTFAGLGTF